MQKHSSYIYKTLMNILQFMWRLFFKPHRNIGKRLGIEKKSFLYIDAMFKSEASIITCNFEKKKLCAYVVK